MTSLPIHKSTLRLEHGFKNYDASTVSGLLTQLSQCREKVHHVVFGPAFLASLTLVQRYLILEEMGDFSKLKVIEIQGESSKNDRTSLPLSGLAALFRSEHCRLTLQVLRVQDCDLSLQGSENSLDSLEEALRGHPSLQEFSLVNFDVKLGTGESAAQTKLDPVISSLASCVKLLVLRLEASDLERSTFDGNGLAGLFASTNLVELHLGHFVLTKMHLRMLAWVVRKEPLRKLSLKHSHLQDEDVAKLAFYLGSCTHLQELDLTGNQFGNDGCIALAEGIRASPSLIKVSLMQNEKIGLAGYESLAQLVTFNKQIQDLVVPDSNPYQRSMTQALESNTRAALAA